MNGPTDSAAAALPRPQSVFLPKLFTVMKGYTLPDFWKDLSAGVIVGIVALPLAIAFAIASGVTPDRGLTTAIVAGFLVSCLGGSRVQIGGPTGAFVVIVYAIVQQYGLDGLILSTFMAGAILISMGMFRLGAIIKFIPYPLTVGFTAGIAVVIFSSQVKDFFGLTTGPVPGEFLEKWEVYLQAMPTLNPAALLCGAATVIIQLAWPKIDRRIPGSIVAILVVTAAVQLWGIPVETIGSRFGELPSGWPTLTWPNLTWSHLRHLIVPASTIAMLGAIESLLSATVSDGMIESRHRSNTELIAQGIANIGSALFGGIPATGAIARTATNVKNGGRTPIAGIIHALTLLLIVVVAGRWAKLIPLSVLAGILVVVSYHMSEWRSFKALLKSPRMDVAVLGMTFLLTVFVDLTVAVEVGMLMATVLFMKRMTDVTTVRAVTEELSGAHEAVNPRLDPDAVSRRVIPEGVKVFEAEGAFFFGAAEVLRDHMDIGSQPPKVLILRMRHVLALDATGIRALQDLRKTCGKMGTALILSGIHAQPYVALDRAGVIQEFGAGRVVASFDEALEVARGWLGSGGSTA